MHLIYLSTNLFHIYIHIHFALYPYHDVGLPDSVRLVPEV